jgi:dTDP-4-amino-4,6-dideoxygalactose transaminase
LQCALKSLELTDGEIITTPYSFVATTHSIFWNNLTPVFVDIDTHTLNIDPSKIEPAITPKTRAILGVHTYGMPCQTKQINHIAKKYNLKVIYDAAHAFGVSDEKNKSILNQGDLSILSLHATKVFNTFEGGAIICQNKSQLKKINRIKNFGFRNETSIVDLGTNGKMSEIDAAIGLCQLKHIDSNHYLRMNVASEYNKLLAGNPNIEICYVNFQKNSNYSYYPILLKNKYLRDSLYNHLISKGIYTRRYFYPLISNLKTYKNLPSAQEKNLIIANGISKNILCLPIFPDLKRRTVIEICKEIEFFLN